MAQSRRGAGVRSRFSSSSAFCWRSSSGGSSGRGSRSAGRSARRRRRARSCRCTCSTSARATRFSSSRRRARPCSLTPAHPAAARSLDAMRRYNVGEMDLWSRRRARRPLLRGRRSNPRDDGEERPRQPSSEHDEDYQDFLLAIEEKGVTYVGAEPGRTFDLGDGVILSVLAPVPPFFTKDQLRSGGNEPNANSVVTRLDYGAFSMLLTGDAASAAEQRLINNGANLTADVLKVGTTARSTRPRKISSGGASSRRRSFRRARITATATRARGARPPARRRRPALPHRFTGRNLDHDARRRQPSTSSPRAKQPKTCGRDASRSGTTPPLRLRRLRRLRPTPKPKKSPEQRAEVRAAGDDTEPDELHSIPSEVVFSLREQATRIKPGVEPKAATPGQRAAKIHSP